MFLDLTLKVTMHNYYSYSGVLMLERNGERKVSRLTGHFTEGSLSMQTPGK